VVNDAKRFIPSLMFQRNKLGCFQCQAFSDKSKNDEYICGLYYKHITIINYDCSIINTYIASLTDDAIVVIYARHMFIVQATGYLSVTLTKLLQA
jgi:hypothetical protein